MSDIPPVVHHLELPPEPDHNQEQEQNSQLLAAYVLADVRLAILCCLALHNWKRPWFYRQVLGAFCRLSVHKCLIADNP